jgi:hypothetical protein
MKVYLTYDMKEEEGTDQKKVLLTWVVRDATESYIANQAPSGSDMAPFRATRKATRREV